MTIINPWKYVILNYVMLVFDNLLKIQIMWKCTGDILGT